MDFLLVRVPVAQVIISRLSPSTLGVATLVRPAFYMDTHHVAVQVAFIHEAFTRGRKIEKKPKGKKFPKNPVRLIKNTD